jgi:hypothetical protein
LWKCCKMRFTSPPISPGSSVIVEPSPCKHVMHVQLCFVRALEVRLTLFACTW